MSGKTITATARIEAKDATGSVFDKLAAKFRGLEKERKSLGGHQAPQVHRQY
ncbi:hypothetical protein [Bradyrhizobium jicamae]|uniref:hypothetical protein n=1 Tax=Bradyrhizobium jicamae TaxID=280332 RepID=UPI000A941FC2|nr:hypothetical protein [Bradyrhizobium jicamae]